MDFILEEQPVSKYHKVFSIVFYMGLLINFALSLRNNVRSNSVLKDASKWYKENKELKRKTLYLGDKDAVDEGVDAGESSNDADIENLNRTIKQLSTEVAELQTELDTVRQSEFQTLEQNMKLNEELELRKAENRKFKAELEELRTEHQQLRRVSEMMKKELEDLKEIEENQRNDIILLKKEAGEQKRERNILKHQSTLIMQGLNDSNGTESLILLQEIENLKRTLEDERSRHEEELNSLQDRFEQDQENDSHIEILEERLKLVEEELKSAISRAEAAEAKLKAPPLPPPPPPPPPPPFAANDCPPVVPLRRRRSRATVEDLAKTIGVQESSPDKKPAPPGVNHDIINAIKEGKFTLKKSKKEGKMEKDRDTPKAVSEILNILGSLRRAPKKRQSQYLGDVQL
ncbi:shootin-1 isoform X2 [Sitophilus oryzae]|uniref:Shootin-1 isoform X2 n=1 Tax=Sitophilus oryzae TaxID=7048 RepID=A0A6J2YDC6_SITOR|nr:shootin-1 isoform X2 [Sitophilus oryzae]